MTWEINFLDFLQTIRTPIMDKLMVFFSTLGNAGILWIAIAVILLFFKKYRKWGIQMLVAMALTFIVGNLILKNLIHRPRPWLTSGFDIEAYARETGLSIPSEYSFPSGHTMNGITGALTLFFQNKKVGIAALILACIIAFSRMYNYCHYPTDILGGVAIGICSAIIVNWFFKKKGWKQEAQI